MFTVEIRVIENPLPHSRGQKLSSDRASALRHGLFHSPHVRPAERFVPAKDMARLLNVHQWFVYGVWCASHIFVDNRMIQKFRVRLLDVNVNPVAFDCLLVAFLVWGSARTIWGVSR